MTAVEQRGGLAWICFAATMLVGGLRRLTDADGVPGAMLRVVGIALLLLAVWAFVTWAVLRWREARTEPGGLSAALRPWARGLGGIVLIVFAIGLVNAVT